MSTPSASERVREWAEGVLKSHTERRASSGVWSYCAECSAMVARVWPCDARLGALMALSVLDAFKGPYANAVHRAMASHLPESGATREEGSK